MKECILAAVTASMAIATFLLAYQTLKMRREQIRPVLAIHQYWEDENPPRTGSDYEMVAYDGGGKLLDLALGKSDEKTIVYYIMINNLGNGSDKNLEMRMKRVLEREFGLHRRTLSWRSHPGSRTRIGRKRLRDNCSMHS
jgi:hypothetical protein